MANEPLGYIILPTKLIPQCKLIGQYHSPDWETLDKQDRTLFETPFPVICYAEFMPNVEALIGYFGAYSMINEQKLAEVFQLYPDMRLVYEWKPRTPTLDIFHELQFWIFISDAHFKAYRDERSAWMRVRAGQRLPHVVISGKMFQQIRKDARLKLLLGSVRAYIYGETYIWRALSWASSLIAWGNHATKHILENDVRSAKTIFVLPPTIPDDPAVDIEVLRFEDQSELRQCLNAMAQRILTGQAYEELQCYADIISST